MQYRSVGNRPPDQPTGPGLRRCYSAPQVQSRKPRATPDSPTCPAVKNCDNHSLFSLETTFLIRIPRVRPIPCQFPTNEGRNNDHGRVRCLVAECWISLSPYLGGVRWVLDLRFEGSPCSMAHGEASGDRVPELKLVQDWQPARQALVLNAVLDVYSHG